jgi:hypothetical protein
MKKKLYFLAFLALATTYLVYHYRYYPAVVVADPSYTLLVPTFPKGFWKERIKRFQTDWELGASCEYSLLGWSNENILYIEEKCSLESVQLWRYEPRQDSWLRISKIQPHLDVIPTSALEHLYVRDWLLPTFERPLSTTPYEPDLRTLIVGDSKNAFWSLDRQWLAFIAKQIYGPQDVIVLSGVPPLTLADLALSVSQIAPQVRESHLSMSSGFSPSREYVLANTIKKRPVAPSANFLVWGFVYGPNSNQATYISNELYRYESQSQAQATVDDVAAMRTGSQPFETAVSGLQSGVMSKEGQTVYWSVGAKDNILIYLEVREGPKSFSLALFKDLVIQAFP